MEELWEVQAAFHDCCARREPRAHFFDSMVGQCSPLERTSIEPMARQGEGGTSRGMPRFLSAVGGEEEQRRWPSPPLVADAWGAPAGGLRCDETGCGKKGPDSVGGARQSCGPLGQGANGPGGVFAGSAARQGAALVDKRLFLPEGGGTEA